MTFLQANGYSAAVHPVNPPQQQEDAKSHGAKDMAFGVLLSFYGKGSQALRRHPRAGPICSSGSVAYPSKTP